MNNKLKIIALIIFIVIAGFLFSYDFENESENVLGLIEETTSVQTDSDEKSEVSNLESVQTESLAKKIYVYVCGQVVTPNVYEVAEGARLFEVIEAAGGLCEGADLSRLNLAKVVEDGEKLYIPLVGEDVEVLESTKENPSDGRININIATTDELKTLPGIGEAKAEAIIAYREANGKFTSVEDLRQVPGIKDGVYSQIQSLIKVD